MKKLDILNLYLSDEAEEEKFWIKYNLVKVILFRYLRKQIDSIDWYQNSIEPMKTIYSELLKEWEKIRNKFTGDQRTFNRLKGAFYELLFYYSCIKLDVLFKIAWIIEMEESEGSILTNNKTPPRFEVVPIFEVMPRILVMKKNGKEERKAPQIKADFLVLYADEETGYLPSTFIDVKSKKPKLKKDVKKDLIWQSIACKFHGCNFQIAYPEQDVEYPSDLKEWVTMFVCTNCSTLNKEKNQCKECGEIM